MHTNHLNRQLLLRTLALLSITGLLTAILPLPQINSAARSVDTMTPLRQSLSGLYGTN